MSDLSVSPASARSSRWRVVDIVVASVLGVAVGVVFWALGVSWNIVGEPLKAVLPGFQGIVAALWVLGGPLGALIIRKPGAALFVEILAATVSALIGSQWGWGTVWSGIIQGLGAELVFLAVRYRVWRLPVAILAGIIAGAAMAINEIFVYYAGADTSFVIIYTVSAMVGGALLAGVLPWFIMKALAATGALGRFASGRTDRERV